MDFCVIRVSVRKRLVIAIELPKCAQMLRVANLEHSGDYIEHVKARGERPDTCLLSMSIWGRGKNEEKVSQIIRGFS